MNDSGRRPLTTSHWGTYEVDVVDGIVNKLVDFAEDADPSPIGHGIVEVLDGPSRITAPMVRKSWLEGGPGKAGEKRGEDEFVEVTWEHANALVAAELERVRTEHGNNAIYGGSYGWASAGRFHHAQSQLKRFLNCIGGFTYSKNTYSFAAAEVVVPHVLGTFRSHLIFATTWESIAESCDLLVAFGGLPLKNGQISQGGTGRHVQRASVSAAQEAGVEFVNISPLRPDVAEDLDAQWIAARPSADTALMLGLAHELLTSELHDQEFLDRYTVGFETFVSYLLGETDGGEKTVEWASAICDVPADTIAELAHKMAAGRTMISVAWALSRQDHGEQPFWAAIALASMLGQIGLPGGGIGFGYSAMNYIGNDAHSVPFAEFPQGTNPVTDFIPVARVTEMLENPGGSFDYDGGTYTYPDIRLVWWAGGNPFHHHQDLNRMREAWAKPDTIIANEWCWNSLAKHADIVLPCTTTLERSDIALTPKDPFQVAMDQAIEPVGQARNDHDIFAGIAAEMGLAAAFTEHRTAEEWQQHLYGKSRHAAALAGVQMPDWETFRSDGWFRMPTPEKSNVMLDAFRNDPEANPLQTPSGKIEIYSAEVASFGYDDCPGYPAWFEPTEWLGADLPNAPLHLISNQPTMKLHSQLDHGPVSQGARVGGLEPLMIHPKNAADRGLVDGQAVRIFNSRGSCVAGVVVSDDIRVDVVQMSTGAWFDPDDGMCRQGNPNVLTLDKGTSRLAQGPTAHSCLVQIEAFEGEPPSSQAHNPPVIKSRS